MGQTNCCATSNTDKDIQIDMDDTRDHDDHKKVRAPAKAKKIRVKKKGALLQAKPEPSAMVYEPDYDEDDIDSMLPDAPTLSEVQDNEIHHELLKKSRAKAIDYWYEMKSKEWTFKKKSEGVELYIRPAEQENQIYIMRIMEVKGNQDYVTDYICDTQKLKEASHGISKIKEIEDLKFDSKIMYMSYKGTFVQGSRGFCYCTTKYDLKNGDGLIVNHSTEHPDMPKSHDICGWTESETLIHTISGSHVRVTNVLKVNLNGNLPEANLKKNLPKTMMKEFIELKTGMEKFYLIL
uniref:START domain-containing protein n=1 Tax=Euplotes harpa TaxID=151035 RepID=A0A7S3NA62_9SPIT|eukprot:CAMPEP_0168335032 /NCGR_PEP_ID=MMETSP0213-20121227/10654_1 /TAXON_ID=151035 /ORGANISM="Euplotes harpa, Strain FSP1.4" /LENGTH=292 /DNA_ID=CAMNT_0008339855 /DNA_START=27 /DNA_END=905 /DNA_ORIENTATION=+